MMADKDTKLPSKKRKVSEIAGSESGTVKFYVKGKEVDVKDPKGLWRWMQKHLVSEGGFP